jgi:FMN phosphatase YigB (HAD superfamily)
MDMSNRVDEKSLGLRLQQARQAAGLTQQELCQKASLAYSTLAKIERGAIKSPSIFTIQSIATTLGLSLDQLIGSTAKTSLPTKKVSKSGIRFVYFDINGCLVRFYNRAFTRLAHQTDLPIEKIETAFWHYNEAVCRGEMSVAEFNLALASRLGLKSLDWPKYYLEAVEPIKETQDLAVWALQYYGVGLLSNIMPGLIQQLQEVKKMPRLPYSCIIDSSEVKAVKPEAKIYDIAASKAGVEPSAILLVDDDRANLMAAERKGWRTLWFDDYRPAESVAHIRQTLEF